VREDLENYIDDRLEAIEEDLDDIKDRLETVEGDIAHIKSVYNLPRVSSGSRHRRR